jgi:hypothetical protein
VPVEGGPEPDLVLVKAGVPLCLLVALFANARMRPDASCI